MVNLQPSADAADFPLDPFHANHAMRQALQFHCPGFRGAIVQEQHRAIPGGKVMLQSQNLPPVTQSVAREQPDLGKRVEDDALRLAPAQLPQQLPHGVLQLDF